METLGGDMMWFDRFIAQHAALVYYWTLILFYLASPRLAYVFSELVELHAAGNAGLMGIAAHCMLVMHGAAAASHAD